MSEDRLAGRDSTLLGRLLGAPGPELTCEECFEALDQYVELELDDSARDRAIPGMRAADRAIPGMGAHLQGCPACHEERDSLLALWGATADQWLPGRPRRPRRDSCRSS